MINYENITEVIEAFYSDQQAEKDLREYAKEAHVFVDKRGGQWEDGASNLEGPKFTLDQTSPIIDQIYSSLEISAFDSAVSPANGEASEDVAEAYEGLLRNIQSASNADDVYNDASRSCIIGGYDAWRVVHDYLDGDSFEQDLMVKPVFNAIDTLWFDQYAKERTKKDAKHCVFLSPISVREFEEKYPGIAPSSLSDGNNKQAYQYKPEDTITIGELNYIVQVPRTLALMTNGAVYEVNEEFERVRDDLEARGIKVERERKTTKNEVWSRLISADAFLTKPKKTVFSYLPFIPMYGNYKISEGKPIYWGVVEKLLDPQRIYNYAKTRQIKEGALAPRAKIFATKAQIEGHEKTLSTLNVNNDPVQFYNHVPNVPPPFQIGGPQVNAALQQTAMDAQADITRISGMYSSNMGDNPGLQSGVAIEQLQEKGDNGTSKWFKAREVAIQHTCLVMVKAIPQVYDTKREVRLLKADGTEEFKTIYDVQIDRQTGQQVTLLDLSKGQYDVTCKADKAFSSKQSETVAAINEIAAIDPTIIQQGKDVYLRNIDAPGMDELAERSRKQLIDAGIIPVEQMTEDEKQALAAKQNQPQQPDAATMLAQAELMKAENEKGQMEIKLAEIQNNAINEETKRRLELEDRDLREREITLKESEAATKAQNAEVQQQLAIMKQQQAEMTALGQYLKSQAETLKITMDAIGAEGIVSPQAMEVVRGQVDLIQGAQQEQ